MKRCTDLVEALEDTVTGNHVEANHVGSSYTCLSAICQAARRALKAHEDCHCGERRAWKAPCGLEDCDCGHTIEKLETERGQMRWLVAAVVRGAIGAGPRGKKWADPSCPHGNTPYYPSPAWWCDECWTALYDAIFYSKILLVGGELRLSL